MCRSSLNLVSLDLGIPQSMCCAKVHKGYYEKILSLFTYEFQVKMVLGTPSCKFANHRHVCNPSVNIILGDFPCNAPQGHQCCSYRCSIHTLWAHVYAISMHMLLLLYAYCKIVCKFYNLLGSLQLVCHCCCILLKIVQY